MALLDKKQPNNNKVASDYTLKLLDAAHSKVKKFD